MRKRRGAIGLAAVLLLSGIGIAAAAEPPPAFTPRERAAILSHGPWPEKPRPDTSNRVSGRGFSGQGP